MSRYHSHLNSAARILSSYTGTEPFTLFCKKFFAAQKKYGSTDRKVITHLCYCYFRTALLFEGETTEEKMLKGLFLCTAGPVDMLQDLRPEWNKKITLPLREKLLLLDPSKNTRDFFPWPHELSDGADPEHFAASLLIQPQLFLRIRPGHSQPVLNKLKQAGLSFQQPYDMCVALPASTRVDQVIALDKEAVVQDLSSQRVGELIKLLLTRGNKPLTVWDCCAASGGKSILAKDILGDIELTVSDVRENILINLTKRFAIAGIKNYRSFVADLANGSGQPATAYDLVIADVPCTGSGTWGRSPEQLFYFKKDKTGDYVALQRSILSHVIPTLQPGGYLLYITCSVFKKENEEAIAFMQNNYNLQVVKMELLKGYDKNADTLFAALLQQPLQAD